MRGLLKRRAVLVAGALAGITACGVFAASPDPLQHLEARLVKTAPQKAGPALHLEEGLLTLRYHTRQYQVRRTDKRGRFSRETHAEEGPGVDGLLLTAQVVDPKQIAAVLPQTFHEEFWTRQAELYALPKGETLLVNTSFGKKTDRALLRRVRETLRNGAASGSVPPPVPVR